MGKKRTRVTRVQKPMEPVRAQVRKPALQYQQLPEQTVAPQAAYRRARSQSYGAMPAELRALQRAVGNRQVQQMLARQTGKTNRQMILRSPLSDDLEQIWHSTQTKGRIFDRLRAISPKANAGDADTSAWLVKTFGGNTDDLWLAQTILAITRRRMWIQPCQGPKEMWS